MEKIKDTPPSTPKRERRVKTASLNLAGDERSNAFFGGQSSVPSSVYATPSRRVRQSSVTCKDGDFFGDFPSLNETPAIQEVPDELAKIARDDRATKPVEEKEKKPAPERAPSPPKHTSSTPQKNAGSFFSGLLQKKNASKCVK